MCADIMATAASPEEATRAATREHRFVKKQERDLAAADANALSACRKKQPPFDALCEVGPNFGAEGACEAVVRCPSTLGHAFEFVPDSATTAERAFSFMKQQKKVYLDNALTLAWEKRTELISHLTVPELGDLPDTMLSAQCRLAGVCLCSAGGKAPEELLHTVARQGVEANLWANLSWQAVGVRWLYRVGLAVVAPGPPAGRPLNCQASWPTLRKSTSGCTLASCTSPCSGRLFRSSASSQDSRPEGTRCRCLRRGPSAPSMRRSGMWRWAGCGALAPSRWPTRFAHVRW